MSSCALGVSPALKATIRTPGSVSRMSIAARTPPPPGMSKSSSTTSGRRWAASWITSSASAAAPTSFSPPSRCAIAVSSTRVPSSSSAISRRIGFVEDVTDAQRTQQYGSAERAVLDLLAPADDADTALSSLLQVLCLRLEWDAAELWVPHDRGDVLRAVDGWPSLPGGRAAVTHEMGDGLPGLAWGAAAPGVAQRLRAGRARLRAGPAGLPGRGADRGRRPRLARAPRARAGPRPAA